MAEKEILYNRYVQYSDETNGNKKFLNIKENNKPNEMKSKK
jgi:hypothetical protein